MSCVSVTTEPNVTEDPIPARALKALENVNSPVVPAEALSAKLIEVRRRYAEAEAMGYSESDPNDWLGLSIHASGHDLVGEIHAAPCTSIVDAATKIEAAMLPFAEGCDIQAGDLAAASLQAVKDYLETTVRGPDPLATQLQQADALIAPMWAEHAAEEYDGPANTFVNNLYEAASQQAAVTAQGALCQLVVAIGQLNLIEGCDYSDPKERQHDLACIQKLLGSATAYLVRQTGWGMTPAVRYYSGMTVGPVLFDASSFLAEYRSLGGELRLSEAGRQHEALLIVPAGTQRGQTMLAELDDANWKAWQIIYTLRDEGRWSIADHPELMARVTVAAPTALFASGPDGARVSDFRLLKHSKIEPVLEAA